MSEEVKQNDRRENQSGMNTEGGEPQRDHNSRNGYRNNRRRHSSRPAGRDQRPNTTEIKPKNTERAINPNNPAPGNRNNPRRDNQSDQRRNNFHQDQQKSGGGPARGPKPGGTREHIVREIRPENKDAQNPNQNIQQNRNNRPPQNPATQNNRNREFDKQNESKTWSRNLRSEETSEDIRLENERIEKEIALEISGIHTMKLD